MASIVRDAAGTVWTYYSAEDGTLLRIVNNSSGARIDRNIDGFGQLIAERSAFGDRTCISHDQSWNSVNVTLLPEASHYAAQPKIERRVSWGKYGRPQVVWDPNQPGSPLFSYHWDSSCL